MANRSRPASCIEHAVVPPRHCDPFYQPEFCFVPEALGGPLRFQSSGLIVSTNVDRVAFPSFQLMLVWSLHLAQRGVPMVLGGSQTWRLAGERGSAHIQPCVNDFAVQQLEA